MSKLQVRCREGRIPRLTPRLRPERWLGASARITPFRCPVRGCPPHCAQEQDGQQVVRNPSGLEEVHERALKWMHGYGLMFARNSVMSTLSTP